MLQMIQPILIRLKQEDEIRKGSKTNIDTDKEISGGCNQNIGAQQ